MAAVIVVIAAGGSMGQSLIQLHVEMECADGRERAWYEGNSYLCKDVLERKRQREQQREKKEGEDMKRFRQSRGVKPGELSCIGGMCTKDGVDLWVAMWRLAAELKGNCVGKECQKEEEEYRARGAEEERKAKEAREKRIADMEFTGGRTEQSVQQEIMKKAASIRFAYNRRLREKPNLNGKIVVKISIDESGKVISAKMAETTVNDSELESAVIDIVKKSDFGKIDKPGDVTEITYPFNFSP